MTNSAECALSTTEVKQLLFFKEESKDNDKLLAVLCA
jgi:hypothetical protein